MNGSGDAQAPLKPVDTAKTDTTDDSTESNEVNHEKGGDEPEAPKDVVDGPPAEKAQEEPMETEQNTKEDDGVVDVSGILKDIDDFNRSAEPTPPPEPIDTGEPAETDDAAAKSKSDAPADAPADAPGDAPADAPSEEAMDTSETAAEPKPAAPSESTAEPKGGDEVPDTSDAIAALKSLESYDDVDSRNSNEPEQFSEDILDDEKTDKAEKEKEGGDAEKEKSGEAEKGDEAKEKEGESKVSGQFSKSVS